MPLFSKGNQASSDEAILAIAVAEPTLSSSLQLTSTGKAGLTYKPASGDAFAELEQEVQGLLALRAAEYRHALHGGDGRVRLPVGAVG